MRNVSSFLEKHGVEISISRDLSGHKNGPINFTAELEDFSSKTRSTITFLADSKAFHISVIVALLGNNLADYTDYLQAMNNLGYRTNEYCSILILSQYNVRFIN